MNISILLLIQIIMIIALLALKSYNMSISLFSYTSCTPIPNKSFWSSYIYESNKFT